MSVRILVVDDDDSIRELVAEILREEGYEAVQARNGAAALRQIEVDGQFELVVLDMRMPLVDGWQFASELGRRGVDLPIVVMTAAQNARRWAEEIGAAGYIAKPFGIDELLHAVRAATEPPAAGDEAPVSRIQRLCEAIASLIRGAPSVGLPATSGRS